MTEKKILSRIRKLLRLARDSAASVPEAASALAQAHRLMEKHRIDAAMVGTDEHELGRFPVWSGKRLMPWRRQLWAVLAGANGCSAVSERRKGHVEISLCGRQEDAELVRHLAHHITREIDRLGIAAWQATQPDLADGLPGANSAGKRGVPAGAVRWRQSFRAGAVWEIDRRLRDIAVEARRDARAEHGEAATTAIALVDSRTAVARAWMQENLSPKAAPEPTVDFDPRAFAAGVGAAGRVGLVNERKQVKGE